MTDGATSAATRNATTSAAVVRMLASLFTDNEWLDHNLPERHLAETRSVQLREAGRLAVYAAVTHLAVVATFVVLFWHTAQRLYTEFLFAAVALPCLYAIASARRIRQPMATPAKVDSGRAVATIISLVLGLTWGTMPIALFPPSDADHQLIVVATTPGLIAIIYVLGPIFSVCVAFALPVVIGAFIGLMVSGQQIAPGLALLLSIYAVFVLFSCKRMNRLSVRRIADRIRVGEQTDTIGLLLRDFEENTSDWLWETDAGGRMSHVGRRMEQAAGLPSRFLKDAPLDVLFCSHAPDRPLSDSAVEIFTAIGERRSFTDRVVQIKTEEGAIWWRLTGKPLFDESGAFVGYRGVGSDVTEARRTQERIAYMASYDALTGLANRGLFMTRADEDCREAQVDGRLRALLYLDLDGFKAVNDGLGHSRGDALLKQVASRLKSMVPQGATLARLGGDEFAVIYAPSARDEAEHLAQTLIAGLSRPYLVDGSRAEVGASVGIAFAPDDAKNTSTLLARADLGLYRAKSDGKGRYRSFVTAFELQKNERRRLETDLRVAVAHREFELHFQPLVSLGGGGIIGFEALLRWSSPTRAWVSPADFIPIVEAIGLVVDIGRWVLQRACHEACGWSSDKRVAVNISPIHFRAPDFLSDVDVALANSGLDPARLEIEITESVFLDSSATAIANLHALRRRGVRIALDDFGTGFSSLNYLVRFPVDKIKIDRSFVQDLGRRENIAIVETILAMAHKLAIETTAEGVETLEQALVLERLRCDTIQGYLMSKAVSREQIGTLDALIAERHRAFAATKANQPLAFPAAGERPPHRSAV